jgi:hypothetical protein
MQEACHTMHMGEVLNASHPDYPLHEAVIYGDKLNCAKLSKRLSCAIKHLPIKVRFTYVYDTQKALESGIIKDPTLVLDTKILLEGLPQAEEITEAFKDLLN